MCPFALRLAAQTSSLLGHNEYKQKKQEPSITSFNKSMCVVSIRASLVFCGSRRERRTMTTVVAVTSSTTFHQAYYDATRDF
jgi:hypothetical protein